MIAKWGGRSYQYEEDQNQICLIDIEASKTLKRDVVCAFPKDGQSNEKYYKELESIVESALGQVLFKYKV